MLELNGRFISILTCKLKGILFQSLVVFKSIAVIFTIENQSYVTRYEIYFESYFVRQVLWKFISKVFDLAIIIKSSVETEHHGVGIRGAFGIQIYHLIAKTKTAVDGTIANDPGLEGNY
jgi:hypothetical protein